MNRTDITGIILAGGRSSRMGTDKAFTKIGNKTLIENTYGLLKGYCIEILISANKKINETISGQRVIHDEREGLGPIGGIYSCLKQSGTINNLVVAVDIPLINHGLIQFLLASSDDSELVIPVNGNGRLEPLCAVYKKSVLPYLEKMIAENDLKVQNLMNYCKSKKLPVTKEMKFYDERLFYNVNTPDDLNMLSL